MANPEDPNSPLNPNNPASPLYPQNHQQDNSPIPGLGQGDSDTPGTSQPGTNHPGRGLGSLLPGLSS
ncbi:hypothetical protein [Nocardia sp. NBC_00511]|uniref:hypothetical protein n=1 Tax=Nocardia sp. NBC_00511 TaxID=2903591 RepID=UPI0030DF9EB2